MNGALPAVFRRQRILVVGCGDIGQRAAALLGGGRKIRLLALTSSPERVPALRAQGLRPLLGNLDQPASLRRLAGLAQRVLHLAPPPSGPGAGFSDGRTRALLQALARRHRPRQLVYGSTSGVYGDRQSAWVSESDPVRPQTERAHRRVDAEAALRFWARAVGQRSTVLRIPGIYAPDRESGTPRVRLLRGTPVLRPEDDGYTNHIHADDLARACVLALWRGKPGRCVHVVDDSDLKMGDYFDAAADLYLLPRPPRVSRAEAAQQLSPVLLSFMGESRRLRNQRMKQELRLRLRYPTVLQGLMTDSANTPV